MKKKAWYILELYKKKKCVFLKNLFSCLVISCPELNKEETMLEANYCITGELIPYAEVADYVYECTVSFNPLIHNRATALASQKEIIERLEKYLEELEEVDLVIEYQKNGMCHYHLAVHVSKEVESSKRFDIVKAFQRMFGRTSFKPVIDFNSYRKYLIKDLKRNFEKTNFPHCIVYM